jgi:hypothetical protein
MSEHEGPEGGGEEQESWWQKAVNFGTNYVSPAMHAFEKPLEEGLNAAPGFLGPTGKVVAEKLPFIGAAIGGGSALYHSHEAANTADNGTWGSHNEHWNHVGEATLGGASAAASFCPPAALYLGAGELAANGLGAASGAVGNGINHLFGTHLDTGFSAGSLVGQAEHAASYVSAEKHPYINAALGMCPMTAPIAAAANMGSLVTGAGKGIDAIGSGIGSAAKSVGGAAKSAWNAVSSW